MKRKEFEAWKDFIEAPEVKPSAIVDQTLMELVAKDLRPKVHSIFFKYTLIQIFTGGLTLTLCPQFGFGVDEHHQLLHSLHLMAGPTWFFLICGIFFVVFGAAVTGLLLTEDEKRAIRRKKYLLFGVYSFLSYLVLVGLGSEAFAFNSLFWVAGAFLGNFLGYEGSVKLWAYCIPSQSIR